MSGWRIYLLSLLGMVAVGGLTVASAASLNVDSADLGAEVALVASCDDGVVTAELVDTYFPAVPGYYEVSSVDVAGIDAACNGQDIYVAVTDGTSTELGSGASVVSGTSASVPITPVGPSVDSRVVAGMSIVITGLP